MSPWFGDAGAVDRLAHEHQRAADQIVGIGRDCIRHLESTDFHGPAASRLRDNAYGRLGMLQRHGERLRYLAGVLHRHADWIREQEEQARRQ